MQQNAEQSVIWLKSIGFSPSQIAIAIKSTFHTTAKNLSKYLKQKINASIYVTAKALKAANYSIAEISSALVDVFDASYSTLSKALKRALYSAKQVGSVLKSTFHASTIEVAAIFKNTFHLPQAKAKKILYALRYPKKAVDEAIAMVYPVRNIRAKR